MKACCGSGGGPYNFDQGKMCGNQDVTVCSDPTTYMHWDGFHLTQEANKHVVETLISGTGFVYPEFRFPEKNQHVYQQIYQSDGSEEELMVSVTMF
ncbi:hypothetical protein L1049_019517 [Liquidambar formosana]|uniref:GDSL esterase/lipase n=1 Tax=Liquidambar formosana TaxID=63359 RepID=A0AAP0S9V2_LIQFO